MALAYSHQAYPHIEAQAVRLRGIDRWIGPFFGLACTTMFLDFEFWAGFRIRIFDIALLLLVIAYVTSTVLSGRLRRIPGVDFLAAYGIFVVYVALNAVLLSSYKTMAVETVQALSFAVFFWLLVDLLRDERQFRPFFMGLLVGLWLISVGNAAYFLIQGTAYGFKDNGIQKLAHSYSLVVTVALAAYGMKRRNYLLLLFVVIATALTIMSGERKGWLAVMAALLIMPTISNTGKIMAGRAIQRALVLVALILPVVYLAGAAGERNYLTKQIDSTVSALNKSLLPSYDPVSDLTETVSNRSRIYVSMKAWEVIAERPVFGIGITEFKPYLRSQFPSLPVWFTTGIHNEFLRITAETGYVGLTLYLIMLAILIRRALLGIRSLPYLDEGLRFRLKAGIALLAYGLVMNTFRASGAVTALSVFLPAALIYFQPGVIRLPNGKALLASPGKLRQLAGDDDSPPSQSKI